MVEEKDDMIYCEWCGEFPYYISIHNEEETPKETLLCKECFGKYQAEQEENNNYLNCECLEC